MLRPDNLYTVLIYKFVQLFRELYPHGESTSPYVFICKNPLELLIKFPMSGKHKLFKLDPKLHKAAQKTHKKRPGERGSGVMGL